MAKVNYSYEKHQRDLAKKKKKEDKKLRKAEANISKSESNNLENEFETGLETKGNDDLS